MNVTAGPFPRLRPSARRRAIGGLAAAEIAQLVPLLALERRMMRTGGPGIIPFELAGTPHAAQQIIDRWGPEGCAAARGSLRRDFLFPATYGPLQALACHAAAERLARGGHSRLAAAGGTVAWTQILAPLFDYSAPRPRRFCVLARHPR